jgi:sn-glycerol 3-phosphate transport system permease protein
MVEHRPLNDIIAYAILTPWRVHRRFPVYLALIASTHDAATVVGGTCRCRRAAMRWKTYYRAVFIGGSRTSREPVGHMLMNSLSQRSASHSARSSSRSCRPTAVVYFRFPFRKTAFWIIFVT